jgi:hypothetical protein
MGKEGVVEPVVALGAPVIGGLIIGWGQLALNKVWASLPGGHAKFQFHPGEIIVLIVGGLFLLLALLGST